MKRIGLVIALFVASAGAATAQTPSVISEVRAAIAAGDFARGEQLVAADRTAHGVSPAMLEAQSWLGRGALAARQYDRAEAYARDTQQQALTMLRSRKLDDEPRLPIALGAAIEVQAQVAAARGDRSLAVNYLRQELGRYADTSMQKRIQKNINLLSLQGEQAPALDRSEALGPTVPALTALKGQVVLLFFWAHWCSDCKAQAPILAELLETYGSRGLTIVAPTQRFGYVARGAEAGPDEERRYIEQIRDTHYAFLKNRPVPLAEANHQRYGVSSTPTLVLVDRQGRIAHYNPGQMTKQALESRLQPLLAAANNSR